MTELSSRVITIHKRKTTMRLCKNEWEIAKIYYDARVFLTKTGELYGYTIQSNGKPRCDRLSAQQKIAFWEGRRVYEERSLTAWSPVANAAGPMQCAEIKYMRNQGR